jgi:hypothetical protein
MSKLEVNTIEPQCGTTLTLGGSGDTVTLASGASQSGFGSTGEVSWNTTKKTTGFTAVSGSGYFCDTAASGAFQVTLPSSPSAGNVVAVSDYNGNFATANLTIGRNSQKINGETSDYVIGKDNVTAQFIYVDATEGWRIVFTGNPGGEALQASYITATGGSITTSGNCKIHTFTGPGTFCVASLADTPANNVVSYMVVAGGGGGGGYVTGGGAGGFREYKSPVTPYTASPLDGNPGGTGITVTATGYPITVGAGGAGGPCNGAKGTNGNPAVFSTITSTGGGAGAGDTGPTRDGNPGGSGGSNMFIPTNPVLGTLGAGNTPPVSPPQGNPAGNSTSDQATYTTGGGGGGATAAGGAATSSSGGVGGAGATTSINATPTAYAGGGGGGSDASKTAQPGGAGGGGKGYSPATTTPAPERQGTANTGGGGGGGKAPNTSGTGGSGVVIIRYRYQ